MTNHLATGQHLLIDACGVNDGIKSELYILGFIGSLVSNLDMKRLGFVRTAYVDDHDNKGWSAFQMITTSHISFHGDEVGMGFYLDLMSCKPFDNEKVLALVRETFEPQHVYTTTILRELRPSGWRLEAA